MRRIILVLAIMAFLVAMVLMGSAFADVPPGAGCEGIVNAIEAQNANPTTEDNENSKIRFVAKAHFCGK